jgi:hypothetical protein
MARLWDGSRTPAWAITPDITEFLVGSTALLERLAVHLRGRRKGKGYRVPWDKLDLTDPARPKLKCTVDELARL